MSAPGWDGVLEPGERLLWQGRPDGALSFAGFEVGSAVFGVAMMGFALFFIRQGMDALAEGPTGIVFPLGGLVFLALGANMAGGRHFVEAWKRRHTWYSLTTRRAFIATEIFGRRRLKSFPIDASTELDLVDGPLQAVGFRGSRTQLTGPRASFEGLEDARPVLAAMEKVKAGAA